ncbi:MAG: hypothetical protein VX454_11155 [Pseudomonadota bacterium]|nr:hypothetical protein [Pseudomonadota bacterium]
MSQRFGFAFDDDVWPDADLLDERTRDLLARMAITRYDALTNDLSEPLYCVRSDTRRAAVELLAKGLCRLREAIDLSPAALNPTGNIRISRRYGPGLYRIMKIGETPACLSEPRFALFDLRLLSLSCFIRGVEHFLQ